MHYIEKCQECGTVINQCRCPDDNKEQRVGTCKKCKDKYLLFDLHNFTHGDREVTDYNIRLINKPTEPMKKYIQLKDTWRTKGGEEWIQLNEDTTLYLHDGTQTLEKEDVLKAHPEWFKEVTEPKPSFKKWRAKRYSNYFYISSHGEVAFVMEDCDSFDNYRYLTGNYFQTREEAEAYKARQEAIGRVTHAIIEANEGWEPDWEDDEQEKFLISYNHCTHRIVMDWVTTLRVAPLFPPIISIDATETIISSHKEDLDLIFNVK